MKLSGVHHIAVICSDYRRSLRFYTEILGFKIAAEHYRAERKSYKTDIDTGGGCMIELFSFPDPPPRVTNPEAAGLRHLAFRSGDIEGVFAEIVAAGVPHEEIRTDGFTGKRFFFMHDPDGLPVEIYEA